MPAGVPILTSVLSGVRLLVEIAWGADLTAAPGTWTWTDVTTDVRYNDGHAVTIDPVGRGNERVIASPALCTFQLNNSSGAYTAYNPLAANWPNVRRNTPVRVRASLDGGTTWLVRFQGQASGFVPSWDDSANVAIVIVSASGVSRRYNQGRSTARTPLDRTISSASPVLYYPLETSFASGVSGGRPALSAGTWTFGSSSAPAGGAGSVTRGSDFANIVMTAASTDATGFRIDLCTSPALNPTNSNLTVYDGLGNVMSFSLNFGLTAGVWNHQRVEFYTSGGAKYDWYVNGTLTTSGGVASLAFGGQVTLQLNQVGATTNRDSFSNVALFSPMPVSLDVYGASTAFMGEAPNVRMARLCVEEGVSFATVDTYVARTAMGAQGVDTFINLMRECETTDDGFLYDGLSSGWSYQGISQRYNQATALTLNATGRDLRYPFTPVDDDQANVNRSKVSDKAGVSAVAQDTTGPLGTNAIGVYDDQVTTNPSDDSDLSDRASWNVHAGTIAGYRYPTLSLSMLTNATLIGRWLGRADASGPVLPGCRIDVLNVDDVLRQHPAGTVSVVLEGYQEVISNVEWTVTANCSQASGYDVFKVADARLGRLDTDGSTLASGAAAGATSLSVATTGVNPLWTTTETFDIEIDGIQVTVTGISGTSSPQTFTVTGSTVTKTLASGKAVKLWHPGVLSL